MTNLRQENKKYVTIDNDGSVTINLSTPITILIEDGILMLKINDKTISVLDIFLLKYGEDKTNSLIEFHSRGGNDFQRAISNSRNVSKMNYTSIEKLLGEDNEGKISINDICDIINLTIFNYDYLINSELKPDLSGNTASVPVNNNFIDVTDGRKALISEISTKVNPSLTIYHYYEMISNLKREQK